MSTAENIKTEIFKKFNEIDSILDKIAELQDDYNRLNQNDVLPIGTRVRLIQDYNTPEYIEKWSGWRPFFTLY